MRHLSALVVLGAMIPSLAGAQAPAAAVDWAPPPAAAAAPTAAPLPPPPPPPAAPAAAPAAPAGTMVDEGIDADAEDDEAPPKAEVAAAAATEPAPALDPARHSPATRAHAMRDPNNLRLASSLAGPVGLAHVLRAQPGAPGTVRLGLTGQYFSSSGFPVIETENRHTAGTLSLAYTPLDFLDVYGTFSVASNYNAGGTPPLLQSQGDSTLGVKGGYHLLDALWLGADLRLGIYPGIGSQGAAALGLAPRVLASWNVQQLADVVPLVVHGNLGLLTDGTDQLSADQLTAAETYALGVNAYPRLALAIGAEVPLPWASPFFEYHLAVPFAGESTLPQPDGSEVSPIAASPMEITLGARITALEDVSFLVATDIGLQRYVVQGLAATPPYELMFGVSYTFDPVRRSEPVVVEKVKEVFVDRVVEKPAKSDPTTGRVVGAVKDAASRLAVGGAIVTMSSPGRTGLPPVASEATNGTFMTYDLPAGPVELVASKDGYKPVSLPLNVVGGQETPAELLLVKEERPGTLQISVKGPSGPIDAAVSFEGPKPGSITLSGGTGKAELPAGSYRVRVTAEGFLGREGTIDVADNATATLAFELSPKPKETALILKGDRILTKRTVQFRTGSAELLPQSNKILDEVLSYIVEANPKRIRVDGHTDNEGPPETNQALSEQRAAAVKDYLLRGGIDASKLESAGFGDTRPIAPNITARGRSLNRRVEFTILEK